MSQKDAVNIYDFDHTIYYGDASFHFIAYCLRHNPRLWKYLPGQALILVRYTLGSVQRKQVKQVAFAFLRDIKDVDTVVNAFWVKHRRNIMPWYLSQHQDSDIIISASPEFLLAPIAKELGVRTLIATRMDKHTGKIEGENCRGIEKLRRLKAHNEAIAINEFYSDSLSDMPLLELAQKPYLVKRGIAVPFVNS